MDLLRGMVHEKRRTYLDYWSSNLHNFFTFHEILLRSENGEEVKLSNPHIQDMKEDVLYHLALGSGSHDLEKMFGDVKYVCMGGTPQRMKTFAGKTKPPFEFEWQNLRNIVLSWQSTCWQPWAMSYPRGPALLTSASDLTGVGTVIRKIVN